MPSSLPSRSLGIRHRRKYPPPPPLLAPSNLTSPPPLPSSPASDKREIFDELDLEPEVKKALIADIDLRLTPQTVKIRAGR